MRLKESVGMKEYLTTYNQVKYFLPYLKPYLNKTAFYTKLLKQLSGPKLEVTGLIA